MIRPVIDWFNPVVPAVCLMFMFFTAYGGDWIGALGWIFIAWTDQYLTGQKEKALPRKSYLSSNFDY